MASPWIADWVAKASGPLSVGEPTFDTSGIIKELGTTRRSGSAAGQISQLARKRYGTAVEFERLLHQDFRPALKAVTLSGGVPRPRIKAQAGLSASAFDSAGVEILGFAVLLFNAYQQVQEWEQGFAEAKGLTVPEHRRMLQDAWAVSHLYEVATDALTQTQMQLEKLRSGPRVAVATKKKEKEKDEGRIRIHGWGRR